MIILPFTSVPDVPTSVACCPICGASLVLDIDEYEESDHSTGIFQATEAGVHTNCSTEPDIDSKEWWNWNTQHWSHPYQDWLPIDIKVYRWLTDHVRFREEKA